jgi:hypothetical protein
MSALLLSSDTNGQRAASVRVDHALDRSCMSFVFAADEEDGAMKPEERNAT